MFLCDKSIKLELLEPYLELPVAGVKNCGAGLLFGVYGWPVTGRCMKDNVGGGGGGGGGVGCLSPGSSSWSLVS
jgi:hypothetical protein